MVSSGEAPPYIPMVLFRFLHCQKRTNLRGQNSSSTSIQTPGKGPWREGIYWWWVPKKGILYQTAVDIGYVPCIKTYTHWELKSWGPVAELTWFWSWWSWWRLWWLAFNRIWLWYLNGNAQIPAWKMIYFWGPVTLGNLAVRCWCLPVFQVVYKNHSPTRLLKGTATDSPTQTPKSLQSRSCLQSWPLPVINGAIKKNLVNGLISGKLVL